jgi:hypothetical protein
VTGIGLCAAIIILLSIVRAAAADYNWAAPVSGNFSTPSSWTPTGPPGASDNAIFNLGSTTG